MKVERRANPHKFRVDDMVKIGAFTYQVTKKPKREGGSVVVVETINRGLDMPVELRLMIDAVYNLEREI